MPDLTDKIAVVTGATSGIGKGIARHFASLGARVLITGRSEERGAAVVKDIRDAGSEAAFIRADLRDPDECRTVIPFALETFGDLDILVNNAADCSRGTIEDTSLELWERIMSLNLRAPYILMQEAVNLVMKEKRSGAIINIGSVNAYIGEPKLCAYSASKGGLMTMTKNAASYLLRYRIRVNQINTGWTLTEGEDTIKREQEGLGDEWVEEAIATRPFGRLLSPMDTAYAAAYFASDEASAVTGSAMDLEQHPIGAPPNW